MNVDFRAFRTTALINDSPIATCPLVAKRITSGDAVFPGTVNLQTTGTIVNCPDPINPTDVANLQTVQSAAQDVLDGYFSAKGDLLVGTSQIGFLPAIEPATFHVGANNSQLTADSTTASGVAWRPNPVTAAGDIYTHNATAAVALPISATLGTVLTNVGGASDTKLAWTVPIERRMVHEGDLVIGSASGAYVYTMDETIQDGYVLTYKNSPFLPHKVFWRTLPTTFPSPGFAINPNLLWTPLPGIVSVGGSPEHGWFTMAGAVSCLITEPGVRATVTAVFPIPEEAGPTIFHPTMSLVNPPADVDAYGLSVTMDPAGSVPGSAAYPGHEPVQGRLCLSFGSNQSCPEGYVVNANVVIAYSTDVQTPIT